MFALEWQKETVATALHGRGFPMPHRSDIKKAFVRAPEKSRKAYKRDGKAAEINGEAYRE